MAKQSESRGAILAIKKSIYKINNGSGYDVYHFQTDQQSVKVLDKNNNVLGSIGDYLLDGKVITSGSVNDLKVTGLYLVKGLSGMPSNIPSNQEVLVIVKAAGTRFFSYQVIGTDGSIMNKVNIGTKLGVWSTGGTSLQNTVNNLVSSFGTLGSLKTDNKSSMVAAINELVSKADDLRKDLGSSNSELSNFKNHNHDNRYLRKDTDTNLDGKVSLSSVGGITLRQANQGQSNILSVNKNNDIVIGNTTTNLNIHSKGMLLHNGRKVWSEVNQGSGSGLDADLLRGVSGADYARKSTANSYSTTQTFNGALVANKGITLPGGSMAVNSSGAMVITLGGKSALRVDKSGTINATNANLIAETGDISLRMRQNSGSSGVGFHLNRSNGDFQLYNWESNNSVMAVKKSSNVAEFRNNITIQGRALYLQSSRPAGNNHPVGSIWIS